MITVHVAGKGALQLPDASPARALLHPLNLLSGEGGLSLTIGNRLSDWEDPLGHEAFVDLLDFSHPKGKEVFWHTSAHVLAQAVLRLFPEALPTIGPPIENGFYYDFANLQLSEADFPRLEEEMYRICAENHSPKKLRFKDRGEALARFAQNAYKKELIEALAPDQSITGYSQGEFFDLCRGPHLPALSKIRALKIMKTAGAYWRGDAKRAMLTRIYAISFPDAKQLRSYLHQMAEAKKRDHKLLGPRLGLFSLHEEAPGIPLIHPKGLATWERLVAFWRHCHCDEGYVEIKTPLLLSQELWQRSGHWEHFRENMFTSSADERELALKPMNCPGAFLYYASNTRSYRELPYRVAEIGHVHRNEPSGALSGLMRARGFHQDDAHIFLTMDQVEEEIGRLLHLVHRIYSAFGLDYHLELSTRPDKQTIGSEEEWHAATKALRQGLETFGKGFKVNEGDGAFYGPKIDVHVRDAIGRTWQCATIQLDLAQSGRFALTYTAQDGSRQRPVILHRAIFGSIERFFGILIEHFAGKFPLWLSPLAIRVAPIADRHVAKARQILRKCQERGFSADIDESSESTSKKVREAQLQQINYLLVIGDREVEGPGLLVRARGGTSHQVASLETLLELLEKEQRARALESPIAGSAP